MQGWGGQSPLRGQDGVQASLGQPWIGGLGRRENGEGTHTSRWQLSSSTEGGFLNQLKQCSFSLWEGESYPPSPHSRPAKVCMQRDLAVSVTG